MAAGSENGNLPSPGQKAKPEQFELQKAVAIAQRSLSVRFWTFSVVTPNEPEGARFAAPKTTVALHLNPGFLDGYST